MAEVPLSPRSTAVRKSKKSIKQAKSLPVGPMSVEQLRKSFDEFDKDGNKMLDVDELDTMMIHLGCKVSRNSARKVFNMIDKDGSNSIDFDEFQEFFAHISSPDEMRTMLSAHNQRFFDYKLRVQGDPTFAKDFIIPRVVSAAQTFEAHEEIVQCVRWLSDERFASVDTLGTLNVWNVSAKGTTGKNAAPLNSFVTGLSGVFAMDSLSNSTGFILGLGRTEENLVQYDIDKGAVVRKFSDCHASPVFSVRVSDDQTRLASGCKDGTVVLHDVETGSVVQAIEAHSGVVYCVHFRGGAVASASNTTFCTASRDGHVRMFDVRTKPEPVATIEDAAASHSVYNALWCNDFHVASSGDDYCIKRWDIRVPTYPPVASYLGHTSGVRSLTLSDDGNFLVSGTQDGSVRLWVLDAAAYRNAKMKPRLDEVQSEVRTRSEEREKIRNEIEAGDAGPEDMREVTAELEKLEAEEREIRTAMQGTEVMDCIQAKLDLSCQAAPVDSIVWRTMPSGKYCVLTGAQDQKIRSFEVDAADIVS